MTTSDELGIPADTQEQTPPTPPLPQPPAPALQHETPVAAVSGSDQKSPVLALLLAFIPFGLGHLYLGLYNRALLFFGAFWFSIYLEAAVIATFFYFFTIIDAFRHAQLINSYGAEGEEPVQTGKGALSLGFFLLVIGVVLLLRNWIDIDMIRYFLRDYSPVILILAGIYFIFDAIRARSEKRTEDYDSESY